MSNFWKLNFIPLNFHGDNDVGLIYHIKVEESSLTFKTGAKSSRSNACGHALIGDSCPLGVSADSCPTGVP